jgi:hypothetical protein
MNNDDVFLNEGPKVGNGQREEKERGFMIILGVWWVFIGSGRVGRSTLNRFDQAPSAPIDESQHGWLAKHPRKFLSTRDP